LTASALYLALSNTGATARKAQIPEKLEEYAVKYAYICQEQAALKNTDPCIKSEPT
jgi:hypothetical protein